VTVRIGHVGLASMTVAQQARRAGELLAEGTIRVGCIDLGTFRPRRIPEDILARIREDERQQATR
jgi:acyl-CoA thioester hydrolase